MSRLTQEEAERRYAERGFTLLGEYVGGRTPVRAKCYCGNDKWYPFPENVFAGYSKSCGCDRIKRIRDAQRLPIEQVDRRFEELGMVRLGPYVNQDTKTQTRCHCGNEDWHPCPRDIFSKHLQGCGCGKFKDVTGDRFGHLKAIRRVSTRGQAVWLCQCDCGGYKEVPLNSLVTENTTSCGCMAHTKRHESPFWRGEGEISGVFWKGLKANAKRRNIPLRVSMGEAWRLFLTQKRRCALTDAELCFGSHYMKEEITASLDRKDSGKGYVRGNVQWVHKRVNTMKWAIDGQRFVDLCHLVVNPIKSARVADSCRPKVWRGNFRGYGNISGSTWRAIKADSREGGRTRLRRDIAFEVTIEEAWHKFLAQRGTCKLTGLELDWDEYLGKGEDGKVRFRRGSASLDRIDSKAGYTVDNVQWVHKEVNIMKGDLETHEFRRWCRLVSNKE